MSNRLILIDDCRLGRLVRVLRVLLRLPSLISIRAAAQGEQDEHNQRDLLTRVESTRARIACGAVNAVFENLVNLISCSFLKENGAFPHPSPCSSSWWRQAWQWHCYIRLCISCPLWYRSKIPRLISGVTKNIKNYYIRITYPRTESRHRSAQRKYRPCIFPVAFFSTIFFISIFLTYYFFGPKNVLNSKNVTEWGEIAKYLVQCRQMG